MARLLTVTTRTPSSVNSVPWCQSCNQIAWWGRWRRPSGCPSEGARWARMRSLAVHQSGSPAGMTSTREWLTSNFIVSESNRHFHTLSKHFVKQCKKSLVDKLNPLSHKGFSVFQAHLIMTQFKPENRSEGPAITINYYTAEKINDLAWHSFSFHSFLHQNLRPLSSTWAGGGFARGALTGTDVCRFKVTLMVIISLSHISEIPLVIFDLTLIALYDLCW